MRRFSMLTCLLASAGMMIPAFALAEEAGTYRPGQTYHTVTASSPMQCAQQCQGDAQCKGWNFVRPRQISRTGICEFNAQKVSPVPSQVSISGDNETARSSHRIISAGTNTVRVGTPSPQAYAQPNYQAQRRTAKMPMQQAYMRRLGFPASAQASPEHVTAQQAARDRLPMGSVSPQRVSPHMPDRQMQASARQPASTRIEHNLDDPSYRGPNVTPQMAQAPIARRAPLQTQRFASQAPRPAPNAQRQAPVPPHMRIQHHLDDGIASAAYQARPQVQTQPQMQQAAPRSPVIMRHHLDGGAPQHQARGEMPPAPRFRQPEQTPGYAPPYTAPQPMEPQRQQEPQAQQQLAQQAPRQARTIASLAGAPTPPSAPQITLHPSAGAPTATAQTRTGLYGSLYDDVQRDGVTAPLALTKQNTPTDPDVPIPTVRYIPTAPVSTASLPAPYGR